MKFRSAEFTERIVGVLRSTFLRAAATTTLQDAYAGGERVQAVPRMAVVSSALVMSSNAPAEATARVTRAAGCCQFLTASAATGQKTGFTVDKSFALKSWAEP